MTKCRQGEKSSTTRIRTKEWLLIACSYLKFNTKLTLWIGVNCLPQKIVLHEGVSLSLRLSNRELAEAQLRIAEDKEVRAIAS